MASYISFRNGAWSDPLTWADLGAGPPADGDTATVNHNVYINSDVTVGDNIAGHTAITVGATGILRWYDPVSADWTLTVKGNIGISAGGLLQIGTEASPIPDGRIATLAFAGANSRDLYVNGTLRIWGCPSYHMASESMQRARLAADAASGSGVTITLDRDVDWSVGDIIWIGTGGTPEHTPTACEKIAIETKINASTYTVGTVPVPLVNNHFGNASNGDIVIHASRNVLITGVSAAIGFSISSNAVATGIFDINWARFLYGGYLNAGVFHLVGPSSGLGYGVIPIDNWKFRSLIFDDKSAGTYAIYAGRTVFYTDGIGCGDWTFTNWNNLHFWGWTYGIYARQLNKGAWNIGNLSFVGMPASSYAYYAPTDASNTAFNLRILDLWHSGVDKTARVIGYCAGTISIDNILAHNAGTLLWSLYANDFTQGALCELGSGEAFHIASGNVAIDLVYNTNENRNISLYVKNMLFRDVNQAAWKIANSCINEAIFVNCSFDECAATTYVINFSGGSTRFTKFLNCTFGTNLQNVTSILGESSYYLISSKCRLIFDNCSFKNKSAATPAYDHVDWIRKSIFYVKDNAFIDWTDLCKLGPETSLEFINPSIDNGSGSDQWAIDYPNYDRIGFTHQGLEVFKLDVTDSNYRDGSYRRKFKSLMGTQRNFATKASPIIIPVGSGETITVKLYLKKNVSQVTYNRPVLHLEGCGIYQESTMTDVVDTWEQVSVSGTAQYTGVMRFYLSCRGVPYNLCTTHGTVVPIRTTVSDYAYAYPFDTWCGPETLSGHATLTTGLIAYYSLNGNANDNSGNGHNGSLVGGPISVGCRLDRGYLFNGTSRYINCGTSLAYETATVSVSLWAETAYTGTAEQSLAAKASATVAHQQWMLRRNATSKDISFNVQVGGTLYSANSLVIPDTGWRHYVGTYDGNNVKIYVDGNLKATTPIVGSITTNASLPIYIAARVTGTGPYTGAATYYNGAIDEVGIWDKALTQEEVTDLYNDYNGLPYSAITTKNLMLYADELTIEKS